MDERPKQLNGNAHQSQQNRVRFQEPDKDDDEDEEEEENHDDGESNQVSNSLIPLLYRLTINQSQIHNHPPPDCRPALCTHIYLSILPFDS